MSKVEPPGLYIHVPFCRTKCPYCDFYSQTTLSLAPVWLKGLRREIMHCKARFGIFDSLYLGGGTPSLLRKEDLDILMEDLFHHFNFSPGAEITIEANPDDLTAERLNHLRSLGFNRISLGVQSFNDRDLALLRRRHSALQTKTALEGIRAVGFANLNIDLMYGIPGQTRGGWIRNLEQALAFDPEHLSCYQLTIMEGTPFGQMVDRGEINPPDDEMGRALFLLTAEHLEQGGYIHYEISNFAREEAFISRHNSKYWRHTPYLGLGPAAHSFCAGSRWWNARSVREYCEILDSGRPPVVGSERLSREQLHLEALYLGFRTMNGVDRKLLPEGQGTDKTLRALSASGLIRLQGKRVLPTREGFLVADSLPLLFSR